MVFSFFNFFIHWTLEFPTIGTGIYISDETWRVTDLHFKSREMEL